SVILASEARARRARRTVAALVSLRLNDSPRYEEFYGFAHALFAATQDGRHAFVPVGPHGAVLRLLLGAIGRHERVAALTGGRGAGKTIVCRARADRRTVPPPRGRDASAARRGPRAAPRSPAAAARLRHACSWCWLAHRDLLGRRSPFPS